MVGGGVVALIDMRGLANAAMVRVDATDKLPCAVKLTPLVDLEIFCTKVETGSVCAAKKSMKPCRAAVFKFWWTADRFATVLLRGLGLGTDSCALHFDYSQREITVARRLFCTRIIFRDARQQFERKKRGQNKCYTSSLSESQEVVLDDLAWLIIDFPWLGEVTTLKPWLGR